MQTTTPKAKRTERLTINLQRGQKRKIAKAARLDGRSLSSFALHVLAREVARVESLEEETKS